MARSIYKYPTERERKLARAASASRHAEKNREILNARAREYYAKNRDALLQKSKDRQRNNPERVAEYRRKYQSRLNELRRTDRYRKTRRNYIKKRMEDPLFKLKYSIRNHLRQAVRLTGNKKTKATFRILGCYIPELKAHLESLWLPGMSWDNYGYNGWHIDHKVPLASANTISELESLCHYTNLQPLWKMDNLKKSNKT